MDTLTQMKLSKMEWDSVEIPVTEQEKSILDLIRRGYHDRNIRENYTVNLNRFTKIEVRPDFEHYMYTKYFKDIVKDIITKYCKNSTAFDEFMENSNKLTRMKSADTIRVQNVDSSVKTNSKNILEFELLEFCRKICKRIYKETENYLPELYTLIRCRKLCSSDNTKTITYTNSFVLRFVDLVIKKAKEEVSVVDIISEAPSVLEQNQYNGLYNDITLYSHQKELYHVCETQKETPKLIMYIAPTGTGKTLSPIGLSEGSRVLFVCVGRHIGLSLAKSAISVGKKVGFAFGCNSAADIRLHYFAAADYTTNTRTGRIAKVDNTNGSKVEILICDVQSYLYAMYYMLSFNDAEDVITYWDEPTMTLDYESHELHDQISKNWKENQVPNVILSCATLPKEHEIPSVIQNFQERFQGSIVNTISSYDYVKTIPIVDSKGYAFLPHIHYKEPEDVARVAEFCSNNKTLLRYFDLNGIVQFIKVVHYLHDKSPLMDERYTMDEYFEEIAGVTMASVKGYYLILLQHIDYTHWATIHQYSIKISNVPKIKTMAVPTENNALRRTQSVQQCTVTENDGSLKRHSSESNIIHDHQDPLSGVRLTTRDAHTLTDGPTIYLADNLINIAKLYVHQSSIPQTILNQLLKSIEHNANLQETIEKMESDLHKKTQVRDNSDNVNKSEQLGSGGKTSSKKLKEKSSKDEATESLEENIRQLRKQMHNLSLHPEFIPNSTSHQEKWANNEVTKSAFMSNIDQNTVKEIMELSVDQSYKVLVLMGIGVLMNHNDAKYEEIVKKLAQEQKLYLILTSTDYIYGTNYQFCHGFIGKDLQNMTQQKLVQIMGRIGRNHYQKTYSVRFRSDEMIERLFTQQLQNTEADNMNRLFS